MFQEEFYIDYFSNVKATSVNIGCHGILTIPINFNGGIQLWGSSHL